MRVLIAGMRSKPETFLERLILGLAGKGVEVVVGTPTGPPSFAIGHRLIRWVDTPSWSRTTKVNRLLRIPVLVAGALSREASTVLEIFGDLRSASRPVDAIRTLHSVLPLVGRKCDVIYFPWVPAAASYPLMFTLGSPVILGCRGRQVNINPWVPRNEGYREALAGAFHRAAAVHCVSDAILREAVELGAFPGRCRVIRPAVDPDVFFPVVGQKELGGALRLVTTSSLIWGKGYEYLLVALRSLIDQGVAAVLDIIGEGPERERVLYTINDLGLNSVVTLLGGLEPEDVRVQLNRADVFVLSSLSEGISNAVLEAMSCGLPVVTTDCGGMREAVSDGVEGFVVPVRQPDAMADVLQSLAQDSELRKRMGEAGRSRVLREFSLDHQIDQWGSLLAGTVCSFSESKIPS